MYLVRNSHAYGRVNIMSKKLTIRFQVSIAEFQPNHVAVNFEYYLKDLLETSILPALDAELIPLSLEVKKARA